MPSVHSRVTIAAILLCLSLFAEGGFADVHSMPAVTRTVLSNGLTILHSEEHSLPFVTVQLIIDAGSSKDPLEQAGLSHLTTTCLLLGTKQRSPERFSEDLDFLGASLTASSGRDFTVLSLKVLTKDLAQGFGLFMETLLEPLFDEHEIEREKTRTIAAIHSAEDDPGDVAERAFTKAIFGNGPYGHPVEGTMLSVPNITRNAMLAFHRMHYRPDGAVLAIIGDITKADAEKMFFGRLGRWPRGDGPSTVPVVTPSKKPKTIRLDRPITQTNIVLGVPGINRSNPDYYAFTVLNYILGGGGFSSRLMAEVRSKRGLAYSVASGLDAGKVSGSFSVTLQTKNSSAQEVLALVYKELLRMRRQPVSADELQAAKKYLIGSFPLRFDSQSKLAGFLTQVEYFGLGLDYPQRYPALIQSVTPEDIQRIADRYLCSQEDCTIVAVGDIKKTGLDKAGPAE